MASTKPRNKWNKRKVAQRFFQYLILTIIAVIVLVPVVMLVFGALKTRGELMSHPYTLPIPPRWENIPHHHSHPACLFCIASNEYD
jgi:ABC-type glycerol-3-phosphate transport system permease component